MEYLGRIFKYLKNYKLQIALILLVQLLYAFFSIFTLTLLVPFLQVLFQQVDPVTVRPAFSVRTTRTSPAAMATAGPPSPRSRSSVPPPCRRRTSAVPRRAIAPAAAFMRGPRREPRTLKLALAETVTNFDSSEAKSTALVACSSKLICCDSVKC